MANFQVTNTNDSGTGSLRQAILDANTSAGADTISFSSSLTGQTIDLVSGQLRLTDSVAIDGDINNDGRADITVNTTTDDRIFWVQDFNNRADKSVKIEGLILTGDEVEQNGAGIFNRETLTLVNSTIRDLNSDSGDVDGFGLYNAGVASVQNTSFRNLTPYTGIGIGIFNSGTLTLTGGAISGNSTYNSAPALFNSGTATIQGIRIENNDSANGSGGIGNTGTITVKKSIITRNVGSFGSGGALYNGRGGQAIVEDSTVSNNTAAYDGGGIDNAGTLTVSNSSIINNTVDGSTFGSGTNSYGGGLSNSGTATIQNSTVSGNTATAYSGYAGYGGGIANSGQIAVTSSTVSSNRAQGSSSRGGGLFNTAYGGPTTTTLSSTIVGNNSASSLADIATVGGGVTVNASNSLIEVEGGQVNGTSTNNIFGLDPGLDPAGLRDNGGPTQTIALVTGSPAINAGLTNGFVTDQRGAGFNRIVGGQADIGAFEVQSGDGGSDNRIIRVARGVGGRGLSGFGGFGPGEQPTAQALANLDTLKFVGRGLTAQNLLLRNRTRDLILEFDGIGDTRIVLANFRLQDLDNSDAVGNVIFDGQSQVTDSIDVISDSANPRRVADRNKATFLNDRDNQTNGLAHSNDVINAQAGDDTVFGLTGNDVLRGKAGNDTLGGGGGRDLLQGGDGRDKLFGGSGNDTLDGGSEADIIRGNAGNDLILGGGGRDMLTGGDGRDTFAFSTRDRSTGEVSPLALDTITDFERGQDKIGLDRRTFSALDMSGGRFRTSDFASVASDWQVEGSSGAIVFSRSSSKVFYNANGAASGLGVDGGQFAKLNGIANLSANDFTLIG